MVLKREKRVGRTRIKEDGKYMHRSQSHRLEEEVSGTIKTDLQGPEKEIWELKSWDFFPWCVPR